MIPTQYSCLERLTDLQLSIFPEHAVYLTKRFAAISDRDLRFAELVAEKITRIAGTDLHRVCEDYRWLSDIMLEEEVHFRRTGRYRLSTFAEADAQVYSNLDMMPRYMNGVLASQLWWRNHSEMLQYFHSDFLGGNPPDFRHLEIGPGHGLFLSMAAASPRCRSAQGWDISDTSIANTRRALSSMGFDGKVILRKAGIMDAPRENFDSITFSEVLEHLERPADALAALRDLLAEEGRMFLNVPVNSPAPDHLYLFQTPEQVFDMVINAGFYVVSSRLSSSTGVTLEYARKRNLTISVGIIVRKI
jgi:2-polyprenyl-3-methyl-5-hydroxy-6-metoxy-1,4-benzoquinol methylase